MASLTPLLSCSNFLHINSWLPGVEIHAQAGPIACLHSNMISGGPVEADISINWVFNRMPWLMGGAVKDPEIHRERFFISSGEGISFVFSIQRNHLLASLILLPWVP